MSGIMSNIRLFFQIGYPKSYILYGGKWSFPKDEYFTVQHNIPCNQMVLVKILIAG
jgi:hypothetical protein